MKYLNLKHRQINGIDDVIFHVVIDGHGKDGGCAWSYSEVYPAAQMQLHKYERPIKIRIGVLVFYVYDYLPMSTNAMYQTAVNCIMRFEGLDQW